MISLPICGTYVLGEPPLSSPNCAISDGKISSFKNIKLQLENWRHHNCVEI